MTRYAALAACALLAATATPALADDEDGSLFDMRYALDYQMWSVSGAAGAPFDFAVPMHMFSVTDHTGSVLAAASSVSRTQANRMNAENAARDKAVREGKTSYAYSYAMEFTEPKPGLHFGMQLGFGTPGAVTGLPAGTVGTPAARLFRLNFNSDVAALGPGTLAWDAALSYFSLGITNPGSRSSTPFSSSYTPLGVSYRMAVPVPVLGALIVEPSAHLDIGRVIGSGFKSYAANDVGVMVGYMLHPQWRLESRLMSARQSQTGGSPNNDDTAGVTSLSLGTTMIF
jgi:hypothetical protein